MISSNLSSRVSELRERREAFVTATVVRAQAPTSAEPGSVALVHSDGTIEGFVGGVCAEQSVRLYSLKAIDCGEPLLLRILPDAGEDADPEEGAVTVHNPCLSGGAIEIFLEPALPPPRVRVAGDSLIAAAVRNLCAELGLDLEDGAPAAGDLALVVAAHGRDELGALQSGLEAGVPYVGLVASRVRGTAVIDELRADGVPAELLARIETPAGLDIGARTPAEIALSILARIVEVRRASGARAHAREPGPAAARTAAAAWTAAAAPTAAAAWTAAAAPTTAAAPITAVDPICGMTVLVGPDTPSATDAGGELVYFCCEGCQRRYEAA
jgi:xanthine dehydrogenase accessory factor